MQSIVIDHPSYLIRIHIACIIVCVTFYSISQWTMIQQDSLPLGWGGRSFRSNERGVMGWVSWHKDRDVARWTAGYVPVV